MGRRYEAFIAEERVDIEIARCEAELKVKRAGVHRLRIEQKSQITHP